MEVTDISELYSDTGKTLDREIDQIKNEKGFSSKVNPLNLLVVSPEIKLHSSFSRTAKYVLKALRSNKTVRVQNYDIKTREIDELVKMIPKSDILFFILPPAMTENILNLIQNLPRSFECWYYFKPQGNLINTQLTDWLNKEFSAIFVPSMNLKTTLKSRIHRPVELLNFGASNDLFYPVNKESARKIINIPSGKRIWLAPAANVKTSRLDVIIQSFIEFLSIREDKGENDVLVCLGNISNSNGLSLQNIFMNELASKGLDKKKYETSIIFLEPSLLQEGLSEHILNSFYNAADFILFANSYSNHSYTPIECAAVKRPTIICPRHSWFIELLKDRSNVIWCDPIQGLYRSVLEGDGIDYILHPSAFIKAMKEAVEKQKEYVSEESLTMLSTTHTNVSSGGASPPVQSLDGTKLCLKSLEKRLLITKQERQSESE